MLFLGGSTREGSFNEKLLKYVANYIQSECGVQTQMLPTKELLCIPVFRADLEEEHHIPQEIIQFAEELKKDPILCLAVPEYNGSMPAGVKSIIDWVSRLRPMPLDGVHVFLLSASTGKLCGIRGLWQSRVPFEVLGCHVFPQMYGLGKAHEAFDDKDQLKDFKEAAILHKLIQRFVNYTNSIRK